MSALIEIQLLNGVVAGMIYALVATGLTLIFGMLDIPNFARRVLRTRCVPHIRDRFAIAGLPLEATLIFDGIARAKSPDPTRVAKALEGYRYAGPTGLKQIRAHDHQTARLKIPGTSSTPSRPVRIPFLSHGARACCVPRAEPAHAKEKG